MNAFLEKHIQNPGLRELVEWLLALALAIAVYFLLRQFVFRTVRVVGISMEPEFRHSERLIVLRYWFGEPEYGDVVAFPYKADPEQKFIKRIIGRPGDVIDLADNRFTVNGEPVEGDIITALGNAEFPLTVPEGCYFVLGDNRNASKDSRYQEVGCVPEDEIIGRVVLRFWPLDRFGGIRSGL